MSPLIRKIARWLTEWVRYKRYVAADKQRSIVPCTFWLICIMQSPTEKSVVLFSSETSLVWVVYCPSCWLPRTTVSQPIVTSSDDRQTFLRTANFFSRQQSLSQDSNLFLKTAIFFSTRKSFLNPERWTKIESTHLCGGKDSGRRWRKRRIWRWYYNVKQCTIIAKTDQFLKTLQTVLNPLERENIPQFQRPHILVKYLWIKVEPPICTKANQGGIHWVTWQIYLLNYLPQKCHVLRDDFADHQRYQVRLTCLVSKIYRSPTAGAWGPGWSAGCEEDKSKRASQSFGIPKISHLTIHMLVTKLFL